MSPRRVRAVVARIVSQFRRDHRTLALLFVAPIAIMLLLGWVIRGEVTPETRLAVVNEAGANGERLVTALTAASNNDDALDLTFTADSADAGRQLLVDRQVEIVVVIPADYGSGGSSLRLVTLGLNPGEDATHLGRFQAALVKTAEAMMPPAVAGLIPSIERTTVYGRPDEDILDSFAPVFVGYFAYFFVFILTGISFLRERVGGTLERLLATPVTRAEIVLGYSIGFGIFATIQVALVLLVALLDVHVDAIGPIPAFSLGLGVPSLGSPFLAYLIALVLGLGAVSLGIFLSTFARTEFQILQFIPLVIIPQGLLGGIFWPIETLPDILRPIARVLPVTYAVEGLREVMIAGGDLASRTVQVDLAVLAGIAALFVVLAAATIRREIV